jgi:haloalkane dehalogenase
MTLHASIMTNAIKCNGSNIHYYHTLGQGDPIVFLHSLPTSGYVWRKVLPFFSGHAKAYAPDLIGCGLSDQPEINYSIDDYVTFLASWIDQLNLKNIHLVVHGWGSIIGLNYACRHEHNIQSIAFYEGHIRPLIHWDSLPLPMQQLSYLLSDQNTLHKKIIDDNFLVEQLLHDCRATALSPDDITTYRQPYQTKKSRLPLLTYLQHLPLGKKRTLCLKVVTEYSQFLQKSSKPKCMLYSMPGFNTNIETIQWCKNELPNLTIYQLPKSLHYAHETQAPSFAKHLKEWLTTQCQYKKNTLKND